MRKCIFCEDEIRECMGFVLARDIVNGRIPIREICGKCGLGILIMDETQLKIKLDSMKRRSKDGNNTSK